MPAYPTQALHKHAPLQSVEAVAGACPALFGYLPERRDACPERATATSIACLRGHASASAGLPRRPDPGCVRARAAQLRRRVQRSSAVVGRPSRDRSRERSVPVPPTESSRRCRHAPHESTTSREPRSRVGSAVVGRLPPRRGIGRAPRSPRRARATPGCPFRAPRRCRCSGGASGRSRGMCSPAAHPLW